MTKDDFRQIVEEYGRAQRRALFNNSSMNTDPPSSAARDMETADTLRTKMTNAFHEITGMTLEDFNDAMRGMRVRPVSKKLTEAVSKANGGLDR